MAQWTREKILDFLESRRETLHEMGVKRIGLFGSYVRNEQKEGSDIDFLLSMENLSFASWMDVWNYLEDNLGCEIDLVPEKDLREELQSEVLAEVAYVEIEEKELGYCAFRPRIRIPNVPEENRDLIIDLLQLPPEKFLEFATKNHAFLEELFAEDEDK